MPVGAGRPGLIISRACPLLPASPERGVACPRCVLPQSAPCPLRAGPCAAARCRACRRCARPQPTGWLHYESVRGRRLGCLGRGRAY
eukprot:5027009-Pleurochrysis_carterae.AAC.1